MVGRLEKSVGERLESVLLKRGERIEEILPDEKLASSVPPPRLVSVLPERVESIVETVPFGRLLKAVDEKFWRTFGVSPPIVLMSVLLERLGRILESSVGRRVLTVGELSIVLSVAGLRLAKVVGVGLFKKAEQSRGSAEQTVVWVPDELMALAISVNDVANAVAGTDIAKKKRGTDKTPTMLLPMCAHGFIQCSLS